MKKYHRPSCLTLLAIVAIGLSAAQTASAALIYSENFGRADGASNAVNSSIYSWSGIGGNGTFVAALAEPGAIGVGANAGKPAGVDRVAQVNAGTDLQGTEGLGLAFFTINTPNYNYLITTSEYSFNLGNYTTKTFSWYGGNSNTGGTQRLALQVGSTWYATSDQIFSAPNVGGAPYFSANATLATVDFATANWVQINTTGQLTLGTATSAPTGTVTAFGIYATQGATALTNRFDTFQINAIPEPAAWALLAGGLTTVMIFRRRKNS